MSDKKRILSDWQTWPSLSVKVELAPWYWRIVPHFYADDMSRWELMSVEWLCFKIEFISNTPPFTELVDGESLSS